MKLACTNCKNTLCISSSELIFKCDCGSQSYTYIPEKKSYDLNRPVL